ncbi:MAG: RNA pseudouridine synthase [Desulfobacterales bacterium]|nr:RNA pseudouridine synthase [Desulfobacterales bacterium]
MKYNENEITVLERGKGWLIVYKPPTVSVHNNPDYDLVSSIAKLIKDKNLSKEISFDSEFGVNPVHRLDKETSGLIVLACKKDVFTYLSNQFMENSVGKKYTALVHGKLANKDWKKWDSPLSKKAGGRKNPKGTGKKVQCETQYRVIKDSQHYSLIDIKLITGRKHQIRRHAALSKNSVVCDNRYGSKKANDFLKKSFGFTRLCLHSYSISLEFMDGKHKTFEIDAVPDSINDLVENDSKV